MAEVDVAAAPAGEVIDGQAAEGQSGNQAAFDQALDEAIAGAGLIGGQIVMNKILQTFNEIKSELES